MAQITISDLNLLNVSGSQSNNYIENLDVEKANLVKGGLPWIILPIWGAVIAVGLIIKAKNR